MKVKELTTPGIVIGAFQEVEFHNAACQIGPRDSLYIFSDGVYEITKKDGSMLTLHDFIELLKKEMPLDEIVKAIQGIQEKQVFEDDFSIIKISF